MIVITPIKMQSDEWFLKDRVEQLNRHLGRETYRLEKVGKDKFKLLAVKVINSGGNVLSCLVIVPTTTANYLREIVDELWHMFHRKAI